MIKGRKSEMEKFTGGLYTTGVEAFIPNTGYRRQHHIALPRTLPICLASNLRMTKKDAATAIKAACESTVYTLSQSRVRAELDDRDNHSPSGKYSHWEMKGVPLRIEFGPKDLANKRVHMARHDNGAKVDVPLTNLVEEVRVLLDGIQENLFRTATERRDACIQVIHTWDEFIAALNGKRLILAPWCDEEEVEKYVKAWTKGEGELGAAKTLCTPFDQPELPEGTFALLLESLQRRGHFGAAVTDLQWCLQDEVSMLGVYRLKFQFELDHVALDINIKIKV
ncbi:Proline--tRNA ligase, cytoplasmic [Dichanthelium oligosanthes]|uniref:proline--tRNA ligase n=1 Tax=Dichanthelium oligosanthes TaxID=888268 RepID=A0A1E5VVR3_9POAL|nr:Proline--tRNA ligase, cytoplasmic [Dichanthelium oligosanthes]